MINTDCVKIKVQRHICLVHIHVSSEAYQVWDKNLKGVCFPRRQLWFEVFR